LKTIFLGISLLLFSFGSNAIRAEESVFHRFLENFRKFQTLEANFIQTVTTSFGDDEARGRLWIKRPHLMKWEYLAPDKQLFFLQEGRYLFYVPEDNQVIIQRLEREEIEESPLFFLLGGKKDLGDFYHVQSIESTPGQTIFILSQKQDWTPFTKVILHVSMDHFLIQKMTLYEDTGSVHVYSFSDIHLNPSMSDKMFRFKPPSGVEIIQQN